MAGTLLSPLRTDRITASRLPALLGISPYVKPAGLMREMVRQHFGEETEFTGNVATSWGSAHEADVIAEYELTRGVRVYGTGAEQRTLIHPRYDFLAATPDGVVSDRVLECKAPFKARYTSITERPDYEVQARLQMEVAGAAYGDIAVWRPGQPIVVETIDYEPDWLPSVMPAIEKFLADYRQTIADPEAAAPHLEPLKDQRTDPDWGLAALDWLELKYLIENLTAQLKTAEEGLKALSPDKPARGGGLDLLRFERIGAINYKKAFEALMAAASAAGCTVTVDPEAFRAATSHVAAIRRVEAK